MNVKRDLKVLMILMAVVMAIHWKQKNGMEIDTVLRPSLNQINSFYPSNRQPLQPLSFIKLPVGNIKPKGWIRAYLERQRDGLTGHLGEISAWLDKNNNAWFSIDNKGDHGWEEVPYWLKGYGDLAYILHDEKMIAETKSWLEKVIRSQRPDGFFGPDKFTGPSSTVANNDNPKGLIDLWPNMIMLWCLQSYYEYSSDHRVIDLMDRYFKWQSNVPDSNFLESYWENSRGGDNLYSIYWLYNITGENWLLDLAKKVHRNTADWTQKNNLPNWHNVNVAQCFREPATYYMQTKDSFFLRASYNDFNLIRSIYGQVPGGMFGADENAREGYTDPRQGVETCGMVEEMASDEIMLRITGDPFWADHCEDVAFNTYPAAVMPDFKSLRYITSPNMAISDSLDHSPGIQNSGPYLMMNPFSSRCCQHNHTQGWPYYAENMWMATPDNGLVAMLYNSSDVTARVGSGETVTLQEETHYPFDNTVNIKVVTPRAARFPLYLRIPVWCDSISVRVNGVRLKFATTPASYVRIDNEWKNGDDISIVLPMKLQLKRWPENKNSVSINYGPLTFSLKIKENYKKADSRRGALEEAKWQASADPAKWPAYEILPATAWNYGLPENALNKIDLSEAFEVKRKSWPKNDFPFEISSTPLFILTHGKKLPLWKIDQYGLCDTLPPSPVVTQTSAEPIELIPMGAARLRISAFPVVR
jgi:hypothetical protein